MNHKREKEQPSYSDITWKMVIQKHSGNIMNGCVGRVISI